AGRVDGEFEARAPIVVRIDHDVQLVGGRPHVAPGEQLENAVRMRVERPDEYVEVVIVVGDLGLGPKPGISVFTWLELAELGDRGRGAPDLVVVATIDHHRVRRARGARRGGGRRGIGSAGRL